MQDIIEKFDFRRQVSRLQSSNLLLLICQKFDGIRCLNPDVTDNHEMGQIFELLIYRFNKEMPAAKGDGFEPDPELRDYENVPLQVHEDPGTIGRSIYDEDVPLKQDIYDYFEREVKPYVGDAWIDEAYKDEQDQQTGIVGYTINFNRYFYKYDPPELLEAIEAKIKQLEGEILELLQAT